MDVAVVGLWHLGTVTAACVAAAGHRVVAYDPDSSVVAALQAGRLPVAEPGLDELTRAGVDAGRLAFTHNPKDISGCEIVWIAFDTPVDDDDRADVDVVVAHTARLFPLLRPDATVLVSSQLPVGSVGRLEELYGSVCPAGTASFACSPENLRLGKAIEVFTQADRYVVGIRRDEDRARLEALLSPFTSQIVWMSVESAEMTKHAINAFLAVSVVFANELASLCERVGADAREVERGLKSDVRIGPRAYVKPGGAFAGGTLARDITYLVESSREHGLTSPLLASVHPSNRDHQHWARRRLHESLGELRGRTIALLGLTYKPGTDTLRRSSAVALSQWLNSQGASVRAYDPAIAAAPESLRAILTLCSSAAEAVAGCDAVVVATEWPEFRNISADDLSRWAGRIPPVLDAAGFLDRTLGTAHSRYLCVGRAA